MTDLLLATAISLLVTIDPVGLAPVFVGLTASQSHSQRRRLALKGTVVGGLILFFFAFAGEALLRALGISFGAFRIAGGILLLLVAIDMVFARESGARTTTEDENREAREYEDISVFPLAIPLIAGPGAMTAIVLAMGQATGNPALQASILGVLAGVLAVTLVTLLFASRLGRYLGVTGTNVINRVLGILLTALACQFVLDGIQASGIFGAR